MAKEMDQLTLDSIAAQKAGVSYGKWKALHYKPVAVPVEEPVMVKPEPEAVPQEMPKPEKRVCTICGAKLPVYTHGNARFCSQDCRAESNRLKQNEYYHKKKGRKADGKV